MRLKQLLAVVPEADHRGGNGLVIRQIAYDSRQVGPGDLFVAVRGLHHDGHDHVQEAQRRGASCVVVEKDMPVSGAVRVHVPNSRQALALLSAAYYGQPQSQLVLIGITGTNGKTTISRLVKSILEAAGKRVGLIGTIAYWIGEEKLPANLTTPESLDLQRLLRQMVDRGLTHVVMEVSSHALSLDRVHGLNFRVAVFSNLTRDHLDFHDSLEAYEEAKGRLFRSLDWSTAKAVINRDDPSGRRMMEISRAPVLSYGLHRDSAMWVEGMAMDTDASRFTIHCPDYELPVAFPLLGRFNIYNALAAFGTGYALGIEPAAIRSGLEGIGTIEGRFERVDCGQPFTVIVDYSHTPDALEHCLSAARELTRQRLLVVFGCGGDRDRGKRPLMGEVADRLSDHVIITSDNPRSEDPQAILDDIEKGLRSERLHDRIADRRAAIKRAVELAQPGDCVVVAGKGHETYQLIGRERLSFNDRQEVERILGERYNIKNPKSEIRNPRQEEKNPKSKIQNTKKSSKQSEAKNQYAKSNIRKGKINIWNMKARVRHPKPNAQPQPNAEPRQVRSEP